MAKAIPTLADDRPRPNFHGAMTYILRMRRPSKRTYAMSYFEYLKGQRPEPKAEGISVMTAQGVQQVLRGYMEGRL
jgi:hypothetical protein